MLATILYARMYRKWLSWQIPLANRKEGHAVREPSQLRGITVLRRSGSRAERRVREVEVSAPFARRLEPAAVCHVGEEQGMGEELPAALKPEETLPSSRRRRCGEPSTKGCPVPSNGTASETSQLIEDRATVCLRTILRVFFVSRLCLSSSFHLLFSRLVCPYPQVCHGHPDAQPPGGVYDNGPGCGARLRPVGRFSGPEKLHHLEAIDV